jgi:hypothetical protein
MKNFKLSADDLKPLVPDGMGGCIATDYIMVKGLPVGFMYRDYPNDPHDSGWCFLTGDESQKYLDDPKKSGVYDINTVANYDPAIIPYLHLPFGTELVRVEGTDTFVPLEREDEAD